MSTINSVLSASPESVQSLTRSLMEGFDTNKDGQFSVDEFSNFLNAFMKSLVGSQAAVTGNGTSGNTSVGTTPLLTDAGSSTASSAATSSTPATKSRLNDPLPPCPPGWNGEKWVNSGHTTIKYVAGRIMARYSPSDWVDPVKREAILADFKAAGLNPTASGKDCCDFGDGAGPIDIVQAASIGGKAWQWCPAA